MPDLTLGQIKTVNAEVEARWRQSPEAVQSLIEVELRGTKGVSRRDSEPFEQVAVLPRAPTDLEQTHRLEFSAVLQWKIADPPGFAVDHCVIMLKGEVIQKVPMDVHLTLGEVRGWLPKL